MAAGVIGVVGEVAVYLVRPWVAVHGEWEKGTG